MLGKTALGKYRLVRLLGQGSNAEVFLAEPLRHGPSVVVKRIQDHIVAHPKFRQLFEAEVRSMGKLCHPYAVEFLEAAIDDPSVRASCSNTFPASRWKRCCCGPGRSNRNVPGG